MQTPWLELNIHQKIHIKRYAMQKWGKNFSLAKPVLENLNELHILTLLGTNYINRKHKWVL
jgi:hypothetical protein